MALNFPASPTTGQKFTSGAQTWTYDGTKWISSTSAVTGATGFGATGFTGATGQFGATGFIGATGTSSSPAGSTGFIQYYASATTLGATGALFWDVTNLRLGIGTTSPGALLHVNGNGPALGTGINIQNVYAYGTSGLIGYTMRRSGDTNGGWLLGTGDAVEGDWSVRQNQGSGTAPIGRLYLHPTSGTSWLRPQANSTTAFQFQNAAGTSILNVDSTNGQVGIGTTSPGGILDVTAAGQNQSWFRSSGTNGTFIELGNSTNGYVEFQAEGTTGNFYLTHNGVAGGVLKSVRSGAVANTLVLNSGYACIGTTSGTSTQGTAINASYDANSTIVIGKNNGAGSNNWIEFFYGGASRGYINWNGSGVSYTSTSDYRLKENVVPFVNGLQTVNQLKPVNFDWKENGQTSTGFIAHEVQSVVPEAVSGKKDDVDQGGKPLYQGIDQSKLVVYLVAAIQELTAKVAALETSNTGATGISGATGI